MADIVCKICHDTVLSKAGICVGCCDRLGIIPMPEVTRPPRGCSKCSGMKFVRAIPREYSAYNVKVWDGSYVKDVAAPMALTHRPGRVEDKVVNLPDVRRGQGILEAWVCMSCDFVEWYCHTAAQIPIGPEFMTEVVDFTPDSPYR